MPNLFENISSTISASDISSRLNLQGDNLVNIASTINNMINNPPSNIDDLVQTLRELPLPDISAGAEFATHFNAIQGAIPEDFSTVTDDMSNHLDELKNSIDSELMQLLKTPMQLFDAIHQITQIELSCSRSGDSASDSTESTESTDTAGSVITEEGASGPTAATNTALEQLSTMSSSLTGFISLTDQLPSTVSVEKTLGFLNDTLNNLDKKLTLPFPLPVINVLRNTLNTLFTWKGMNVTEIQYHIANTLNDTNLFIKESLNSVSAALLNELSATIQLLPADEMIRISDDLTARLTAFETALKSGDLSGILPAVNAANTALDEYETLKSSFSEDIAEDLTKYVERFKTLPNDLDAQMCHVISVLKPANFIEELKFLSRTVVIEGGDEALAELEEWIGTIVNWIRDLTNKLNLSEIQEPADQAVSKIRSMVVTLDESMVSATIELQSLLTEVETLLGKVDAGSVTDQLNRSIESFEGEFTEQVKTLLGPAQEIVKQSITTMSEQLEKFKPDEVAGSLRQVIETLSGALDGKEMLNEIKSLRSTLDTVAKQLDELSFTVLADQVIAGINEVKDIFQFIDMLVLTTPMKATLKTALDVLPDNLDSAVDRITRELEDIVDDGPVQLLESVKDAPKRLQDHVLQYEPAALVGTGMGETFSTLIAEIEDFRPGLLLEPVRAELNEFKDRIKAAVDPGEALKAVEQIFEETKQNLLSVEPENLTKPLEDAITGVVNEILNVFPIDKITAQIDYVLNVVKQATGLIEQLAKLLGKVCNLLAGFTAAPAQLDDWIDSILGKIGSMPNTNILQPSLSTLSQTVDQTRAAQISEKITDALDPLITAVEAIDGQRRLTGLALAYRALSRQVLADLPDSQEKTALTAFLERLNPLQPGFGEPYRKVTELRGALVQARSELQTIFTNWDNKYHCAGGTLDGLKLSGVTPAELREWTHEALKPQFVQPFKNTFLYLEAAKRPLDALLRQLKRLTDELNSGFSGLTGDDGPLGGILDSLQAMEGTLRAFNPAFLSENLSGIFKQLKNKLDQVDPVMLREALEARFDEMLNSLVLERVIYPVDIVKIDKDFKDAIDKLKSLDPQKLLVDMLQPEFEKKILPYLEAFDLSEPLTKIIDRFQSLDTELGTELERVSEAYDEMMKAAPL